VLNGRERLGGQVGGGLDRGRGAGDALGYRRELGDGSLALIAAEQRARPVRVLTQNSYRYLRRLCAERFTAALIFFQTRTDAVVAVGSCG